MTDNKMAKVKQVVSLYNMLLNTLWSLVSLMPIAFFCYTTLDPSLVYYFVGISILSIFLPNSFFDKIQIAHNTLAYKKLGISLVQHLSQNGNLVNRLVRKKYPDYKAVRNDQRSIDLLWKQTYVFEKFHFVLFLFFCLSNCYAIWKGHLYWAIAIFLTNLLYNIYPMLLQQYIRLKLAVYHKRLRATRSATNSLFMQCWR